MELVRDLTSTEMSRDVAAVLPRALTPSESGNTP